MEVGATEGHLWLLIIWPSRQVVAFGVLMRTGLKDQHVPNLPALLYLKTKQTFQQITKTLESLRSFAFARRPGIGLGYWMGWAVTRYFSITPTLCSMENKSTGSASGARFSQMLKHILRAVVSVKEERAWELHGAGAP